MLQVVVISFAVVVGLAIIALFVYTAHQADSTLQRRVDAADAGGHRLSVDEKTAADVRHIRPTPPDLTGPAGRRYFAYRKRNALTRRQIVWGAVAIGGIWVAGSLAAGSGPLVGIACFLGLEVALLLIGLWARQDGPG